MKIVIEESISLSDYKSLFEWSHSVFPTEGKRFTWEAASHHIIVRDSESAIAHIGIGKYLVYGDPEVSISVVGVGGVVVRPEYQGQGIPTLMFDLVHTTKILGACNGITTLFCPRRLVSYYEKYGYEEYQHGVKFIQNAKYLETPLFCFMVRGNCNLRGKLRIPSGPW